MPIDLSREFDYFYDRTLRIFQEIKDEENITKNKDIENSFLMIICCKNYVNLHLKILEVLLIDIGHNKDDLIVRYIVERIENSISVLDRNLRQLNFQMKETSSNSNFVKINFYSSLFADFDMIGSDLLRDIDNEDSSHIKFGYIY